MKLKNAVAWREACPQDRFLGTYVGFFRGADRDQVSGLSYCNELAEDSGGKALAAVLRSNDHSHIRVFRLVSLSSPALARG